jgi:hypothetical protein
MVMHGEANKKSFDWWQRREVERMLANELNRTREAVRMAEVRWKEALETQADRAVPPDSNLQVMQAGMAVRSAYKEYMAALREWTEFVLRGMAPEDLGE